MRTLKHIAEDARLKLEQRLTEYRLIHSLSVADLAADLAAVYGVEVELARLGGLLHDWDKNYTDAELTERARRFGIEVLDSRNGLASLLHAQTGAAAVADAYPELPPELIQAIARHTSGATDMSPLDMVIYIADMIEPLRSAPNLQNLRSLAGKLPLEELFAECYQVSIEHLIRRRRPLHPHSFTVWNAYVAKVSAKDRPLHGPSAPLRTEVSRTNSHP